MTKRKKLTPAERFDRLLAIAIEASRRDGLVSLQELSQRFDYPVDRLKADINQILRYVGPPPRTPDLLLDIIIDGDLLSIAKNSWTEKPPQFSWGEVLNLYLSVTAVLESGISANEDLHSAAEKLKRSLERQARLEDFANVVQVKLAEEIDDRIWNDILEAQRETRQLSIDYFSFSRGASSQRVVDVYNIFAKHGSWYIKCWCRQTNEVRTFKCDQISHTELLAERFEKTPAVDMRSNSIYQAQPGDPKIVLRLRPDAVWVTEAYDVEVLDELTDGSLEVRLAIGRRRFLEYLLLVLGDSAEVISSKTDAEFGDDVARGAVDRILPRYSSATN